MKPHGNAGKVRPAARGRIRGAVRYIAASLIVQSLACFVLSPHFALLYYSVSLRFTSEQVYYENYDLRNFYSMRDSASECGAFLTGMTEGADGNCTAALSLLTFLKRSAEVDCILIDASNIKANFLNYFLRSGNEIVLEYAVRVIGGGGEFERFVRGVSALNEVLPPDRKLSFYGIGFDDNPAAANSAMYDLLDQCDDSAMLEILEEMLGSGDFSAVYTMFTEGGAGYSAEDFREIYGSNYIPALLTLLQHDPARVDDADKIAVMAESWDLIRQNYGDKLYIQCERSLMQDLREILPEIIPEFSGKIFPFEFFYGKSDFFDIKTDSGAAGEPKSGGNGIPGAVWLPFAGNDFSIRFADMEKMKTAIDYLNFTLSQFGAELPEYAPEIIGYDDRFLLVITGNEDIVD